jgi:alpha-ketoglutarate-dependent taurine dioxygenase
MVKMPMSPQPEFTMRPGSPVAGTEILDLDLTSPLSATCVAAIYQALVDHHILVFRNQALSEEQQLRFSRNFGDLEEHVIRLANGKPAPPLHIISNLDTQGNPTSKPYSHGNYYWHTDKSYHDRPSLATLLHAVELPPQGGDTQFANTHLAYDALSAARKEELGALQLVHSWEVSRRNTGNRPATADEIRDRPPVTHPLVRTHPDTGRKSLYVGSHVSHVVGMAPADSSALVAELNEWITQDKFVYPHQWCAGDLVMWDNRSLLHRATAHVGMDQHRRVLHRTVVKGDVPH